MTVPEQKARLRGEVRGRLNGLTIDQRAAASVAICERMASAEIWRRAESMLLFVPLPDEPGILPLLRLALAEGRTVCVPGFVPEHGRYEPFQIRDLDRDLAAGRFGVSEPAPGCPSRALNQLDLILVPGVAFDRGGRRLGRGRGFYDRLLSGGRLDRCGVLFEEQLVPEVPVEPHDVRVNRLLTPTRWHDVLAGARF